MKFFFSLASSILLVILMIGCSDSGVQPVDIPSSYDSTGYTNAVAAEIVLIKQHQDFVNLLKTGRTIGTTVDYATALTAMQAHLTEANDSIKTIFPSYLQELTKASGKSYDPFAATQTQGGTYGGYLFDANGLEIEQILDKASFFGLFYHKASRMSVTSESTHKLIALFGATPRFSNSDRTTNFPDILSASYAARRDKNDGNGLYTAFKKNVIAMQAHQKAGSDYTNETLYDRKSVLLTWEKAILATVVNYCFSAHVKFTMTNPQAMDNGAGLHAVAESIGFLGGFKGISEKKITNAQIDDILSLLKSNKPAVFVTDAFTNAPALLQVIARIKSIYGFTDQEIEDFKVNWVTTQNRQ
jgi:hypothetical protein